MIGKIQIYPIYIGYISIFPIFLFLICLSIYIGYITVSVFIKFKLKTHNLCFSSGIYPKSVIIFKFMALKICLFRQIVEKGLNYKCWLWWQFHTFSCISLHTMKEKFQSFLSGFISWNKCETLLKYVLIFNLKFEIMIEIRDRFSRVNDR